MNYFHYHLHPRPPVDCAASTSVEVFGQLLNTWQVRYVERYAMEVTFEQVETSLSKLPRMYFEMDGSFVWRGQWSSDESITGNFANDSAPDFWQVDGMVYDVGGRVSRVELKGQCSADALTQIVAALQPADRLLAFCVEQGFFVRVDDLLSVWKR